MCLRKERVQVRGIISSETFFMCVTKMRLTLGLFLLLYCAPAIISFTFETDSAAKMLGKLKSGFQLAGELLGVDATQGIAQLVASTFGKSVPKKGESFADGGQNIFGGLLRILGLDTKKVGAIAINAIIFVAQLISTSLSQKKNISSMDEDHPKPRPGTPLEWIMNSTNSEIISLLRQAKDIELPHKVVEYVKERGSDEDTGCVQLLLCKSAPFLWGMQKAFAPDRNESAKGRDALFAFLPSHEEVITHGDKCEDSYRTCNLLMAGD